ncbi:hypothetical protein EDB19DRAFT_2025625 [Suillus lakei]|nr:hypothetical protein EDB19DRAFT_2025625 [Suillus lakei]
MSSKEPKDTTIKVVIKSENADEPDRIQLVTFVKSEDGKFDIWNLEHLGLGPPSCPLLVEVTKPRRTTGKVVQNRISFHRAHGVVFCEVKRFNDGSLIDGPIDLIISDKPNEWIYLGSYETSRWGEISPHQLDLLQPLVIQRWVSGALLTQWGKSLDKGGEIRLIEFTEDGLREALNDGRLVINFTVMKCVGYRTEWFEQFLHYQAHPKAPKSQKRKKASLGGKKPSAKKAKGSARRKEVSSESDGDELEPTPPGSDEDEFSNAEDGMKARLGSDSPVAWKGLRIQASRVEHLPCCL